MEFIRKIIDDCDYYLLIIGGRYGSLTSGGISYTEKEYDYAVSRGMKVIALVHGAPEEIPSGKVELVPELRAKLAAFRDKVCAGRLVRFWTNPGELPALLALSLSKTIRTYPAVGWVRANSVSSAELLTEINELRKMNTTLQDTIAEHAAQAPEKLGDVAQGEDRIDLNGMCTLPSGADRFWSATLTWKEVVAWVGPHLLRPLSEKQAKDAFESTLETMLAEGHINIRIDPEDFTTIKIQLLALGIIECQIEDEGWFVWSLTPHGYAQVLEARSHKTSTR